MHYVRCVCMHCMRCLCLSQQVQLALLCITCVDVNYVRVFEFCMCSDISYSGQAYVALSRVSSLPGLRLLSFKSSAVRAHPKVIDFYRSFDNFQPAPVVPAPPLTQQQFTSN